MKKVRLFMGAVRPLPPENRPTGIFKQEVMAPVWLGAEGLVGDAQADRRVHGGPEKALHQFPVAHYARLAAHFPDAQALLIPGSIGENLSVPGWDETNICIGDRFQLGDAVIQVCEPRNPCWKIDCRYDIDGMARVIDDEGITGWYFRVIEEGIVEPGCRFELMERGFSALTVSQLLSVWHAHRPEAGWLEAMAATPGLSARWIDKLRQRAARLRELPGR